MSKKIKLFLGVFIVTSVFLLNGCNKKEKVDGYRSIKIIETSGDVTVKRSDVGEISAYVDMKLEDKDIIEVKEDAHLRILLDNDKYIYVESNSIFSLETSGNSENSKTRIHLEKGSILTEIQNSLSPDSSYEVSTPNSIMAVRGTVYYVEVIEEDDETYTKLYVFDGVVGSKLILPDQTIVEEEIKVEKSYGVLVRGTQDISEYVLFNNSPLRQFSIKDLKTETLQKLMIISETNHTLIYKSDEIKEELDSRNKVPQKPEGVTNLNKLKYNISLYDGNIYYKGLSLEKGKAIHLPTPYKYGYQFMGWYTSLSYSEKFDVKKMPSHDIQLYAKWESVKSAIFFKDAHLSYDKIYGHVGSSFTLPTPQREGYTFKGWYKEPTYKNKISEKVNFNEKDMNVYAKWEVNKYNVVLNNSYLLMDQYTFDYASAIILPTPQREGYTFDGWYLGKDLKNPFAQKIMPSHNISLYAKWTPQNRSITYKNSYLKQEKYDYKVDEPLNHPIAQRDGYIFDGWYQDEAYQQALSYTTMPTFDLTVYAKWTPRNDIHYVINRYVLIDGAVDYQKIDTVKYHDGKPQMEITPPSQITYETKTCHLTDDLEGKKFTIKDDGSLVIDLYYVDESVNYYLIHFEKYDGSIVKQKCVKGLQIDQFPDSTDVTNYTFKGWNTKKDGTGAYITTSYIPTSDITLYEIQVDYVPYKVTYKMQTLDEGTLDYEEVASMEMMGKPNQLPKIEKLIPDTSMVSKENYEFVYPNSIPPIFLDGTSVYTVEIKHKENRLSKINYKVGDEIITRYQTQNSLFIGLESTFIGNKYGYWKKINQNIDYLSTVQENFLNETLYTFTSLFDNEIVIQNPAVAEIRFENPVSHLLEEKYKYMYLKGSSPLFYNGSNSFGYYINAANTTIKDNYYLTVSDYNLVRKYLSYDLNQPEGYTVSHNDLPLVMYRNSQNKIKEPIISDPSVYNFKGWSILKDNIPVDDCFVTKVTGCLGDLKLKANWEKK